MYYVTIDTLAFCVVSVPNFGRWNISEKSQEGVSEEGEDHDSSNGANKPQVHKLRLGRSF